MPENNRLQLNDVAEIGLAAWDAKPFLEKVTGVVPGIIYVYNQQTHSNEYSNRSLATAMGYSAAEIQAMGSEFMAKVAHPEDMPRIIAHFGAINALADGETAQIEYRVRHKLGGWVWLSSTDTVFDRDDQGGVVRHIGVAIDITPQKEAEARVRREKQAADAANDELKTFAYAMSHDMKAPTNTLTLLFDELKYLIETGDTADAIAVIARGSLTTTRMRSMIDGVLSYTHVVEAELAAGEVALASVVGAVVADLSADLEAAGATTKIGALPAVQGDPVLLRMALQNLLANAIAYRDHDRALHISVRHESSADGAEHVVHVTDTGIGIANENKARIFNLFERLHLQHDRPGGGIGLAIAKRVMERHGGRIELTSTLGQGSDFALVLPAAKGATPKGTVA